jgi:hypothetical protein
MNFKKKKKKKEAKSHVIDGTGTSTVIAEQALSLEPKGAVGTL